MAKLPPMKLSVFQRVAFSDFDTMRKAQDFITANGIAPATDQNEMAAKLAQAVSNNPSTIPQFVKIHPDAELILSNQPPSVVKMITRQSDDAAQVQAPESPAPRARYNVGNITENYMPLIGLVTILVIGTIALTQGGKSKN